VRALVRTSRKEEVMTRPILALTLALALTVVACRRGSDRPAGALAPATGLPPAFTPVEWAPSGGAAPGGANPAGAAPQERCATRLRDDRDGTQLQLMRSHSTAATAQRGDTTVTSYGATGDYAVTPADRYGGRAGQWLRVECGSWRGLGFAPGSA
jgi:hypothetical protein